MADAPSDAVAATAVANFREGFRAAREAEGQPDRDRYLRSLKSLLASAERRAKELQPSAGEVAPMLDEIAMAFYHASQPALARRAVDLGLELTPGSSSLLHHKALVLLAQNEDLPAVVTLVDQALEANPNEKGLWATKGDALRLQGRTEEAADAYLRAQELDASSTQYVDRALKLLPHHPKALRAKVELARAHGGEVEALTAAEELLADNPDDLDLVLARAELLTAVGRGESALEPLERIRASRPDDRRAAYLQVRVLLQLGRTEVAVPYANALLAAEPPPDGRILEEIARLADPAVPPLALAARERLQQVEPRNVQNLLDLRALAVRLDRVDVALSACKAVLAVQSDNLEAMRGIAELEAGAGHAAAAVAIYQEIAHRHPHAVAELKRGLETARASGDAAAAKEFSEAVLAADPKDLTAALELARTLAAAGDTAGAVRAYDALLAAHPNELAYLLEKKEVLAASDDPGALAPVLDELFRLDPTRADVALERGNLYLALAYDQGPGSNGRETAARTALVAYERASTDPESASVASLGIARASRLVDDPDRALRAYEQFLDVPDNGTRNDVRKEFGHAAREAGRYVEAAGAYGEAIEAGLEDADLFWGAVEVFDHLNQDARAVQLLDLLLRREPANPLYLRKKGQLLLKAGNRDAALRTLQEAVARADGDPHAYFEVAEALRAQGAYPDALTYYRKGLELEPANRHGRLALAETLLLAGQYPEVLRIVDPLLKEEPNDLAAWKARADAWRALGRPSEVLYSLKAILLLEPDNGPALLEVYRLHRDEGGSRDAYETVTRLLRSSAPEAQDPTLHLERGDLAASLGLTDEANASYERAAEIDPANRVEIAVRRARLRLTAGRPDLALEVLDEGLHAIPEGGTPSVAALLLRAEILAALERPAEARTAYEEVRQREPKSPVALGGIGQSMIAEGRHADAVEFLRTSLPQVPPQETLFLLLAEGEAGLGHLDRATEAVQKGVEVLPKSVALWVRLGELGIARQAWPDASAAFAHALALKPAQADLLLRAGFVAERLDHPNEALALYDRATESDAANKQAWTSRGVALLAVGRPIDAQASFDRALALDSDFAPAKDGKKLAVQKTRDVQVQRFGRDALLLEARLHRTVTKNDLFVTLHVPYEFLEPVLTSVGRTPTIDLEQLEATEIRDLENASYHLISSALERRPPGIERRGFTLADVAVLAPPSYSLEQIQKLFGYLKAVLEADLRPENLVLTPDVEELARKALVLPPEQRTLFQIVHTLRVGIYRARLIKAVEEAGSAVHAPLPSLDLGAYSPEFRSAAPAPGAPPATGEAYFAPENVPQTSPGTPAATPSDWSATEVDPTPGPGVSPAPTTLSSPAPAAARCVGCGGIASVVHACGAPLCQHCVGQFPRCPKCGQPVSTITTRAVAGVTVRPAAGGGPKGHPLGSLKGVFQRPKPTATHPAAATSKPAVAPARGDHTGKSPRPSSPPGKSAPASTGGKPPAGPPAAKPTKPVPEPPAPPPETAPPTPKPKRERDDEPRL